MNPGVKMKGSIESPKTPGGISKSLLTPCRRVGLSRNWGKKGTSPFISPLSGVNNSNAEVKKEKIAKKRKICTSDDEESLKNENELMSTPESNNMIPSNNINNTPVRNIPLSKKKSKTLLMKEKRNENLECTIKTSTVDLSENKKLLNEPTEPVSLSRSNSMKLKKELYQKNLENEKKSQENNVNELPSESTDQNAREKSPNNLSKECIVVIQKKMIKNLGLDKKNDKERQRSKPCSQTLFDSDDETPLCDLGKKENHSTNSNTDEQDFADTKVKKLKDKNTSTTGLKTKTKSKQIVKKPILEIASQNSFDDDDDFDCFNKKTILIKKSYDKVVKPNKAKSTGSITQRDIDELKARIEMKKKQLLVKAISDDTSELRDLIKKWQKGCQEALFELFDLMRKKFPDKQNMDYSEILQTLKIPPDLVGYDVENDCFVTPDDDNIILSSINT